MVFLKRRRVPIQVPEKCFRRIGVTLREDSIVNSILFFAKESEKAQRPIELNAVFLIGP